MYRVGSLLTNRLLYGYNIMRARAQPKEADLLPLYRSKTMVDERDLDDIQFGGASSDVYKQMLPLMLQNATQFFPSRNLVAEMSFCPKTSSLILKLLRPDGFANRNLDIKNVIPWTYSDLLASCPYPSPSLPFLLDTEMIYYSTFLRQAYLFEKSGEWHQQNVKHPQLSIENLYCEKKWHDKYKYF